MDFSPELTAALTTIAIFALQAIAKKIPDDATGFKGIVRKIIKFVTAYVENNTGKKPGKREPEKAIVFPPPTDPPEEGGGGG